MRRIVLCSDDSKVRRGCLIGRPERALHRLQFMYLSPRLIGGFAATCLLLTGGRVALAQNAFSPGGNDYPILGPLAGDQTMVHASIGSSGGWLVWQDNATDTNGLGVSGWRLNSSLRMTGPKVRLNATQAGDQEMPQVARLTGGNTAFVWQGGKQGFQKIYTRFMTPNGSFLTASDVLVNTTYTNNFQINPAIAALADGGAVVVWASYEQDGFMQGVFGRRYNADGSTNGGVFQVNQFTLNNQRSPAVAALPNGGFVVAWISELQRGQSSVDVFARVYNSSGTPTTTEFPINTSTTNVCANPSVAVLPNGNFAVAWSQRDDSTANNASGSFNTTVLTVPGLNSWDVWARCYGSSGAAIGLPVRMNTYTYGDQYAPKLSAFGQSYLACWSSLGQDGVLEGVFGQFLTAGSGLAGVEFRINTDTGSRQIFPTIASDASSRFLALWSSYATSGNVDVFARVYDLIQVSISTISGGVRVSWNAQPGLVYQLQASQDFINWSNYGATRTATDVFDSVDITAGQTASAYRVIRIQN
jgi:hypothetical protein